MNKESIYHRTEAPWAYQINDKELEIILKTSSKDELHVNLLHGDPMFSGGDSKLGWSYETTKMKLINEDELFKYYKAKFSTKSKRCRYLFEIMDSKEKVIFGERFFYDKPQAAIDNWNGFTWGYVHSDNTFKIPSWYKGTKWYQIFVDRFHSTNDNSKLEGKDYIKEEVTDHSLYGGDINGVIAKLDYIKELGFNGIYFTPIFKAPTSHKYNTVDYYQIDPQFGTEEDFKKLIKEAHKRDIKVILDAVFNHIGWTSKEWQDVLNNGKKSKYSDWFMVRDWNNLKTPSEYRRLKENLGETIPYEMFATVPEMPRLNWANEEVSNHLIGVIEKWLKLGIDGWRLDVSFEPTFKFWRDIYNAGMKINQDLVIIGEVWWDSILYLQGDMWHGVMNYPVRGTIMNFFDKKIDSNTFVKRMNKHQMMYTPLQQCGMFNLISSHDTSRWLTELNGNIKIYKIGMAMMYFIQGTTSVFYGEEIGLPGKMDPDCRRPMVWNNVKYDLKPFYMMINEMKSLLEDTIHNNEHLTGYINNNKVVFEYENKKAKIEIENDNCKIIINDKIFEI